jgi:DNA-directed RNA polymerase specialized sigma24 family protein
MSGCPKCGGLAACWCDRQQHAPPSAPLADRLEDAANYIAGRVPDAEKCCHDCMVRVFRHEQAVRKAAAALRAAEQDAAIDAARKP